MQRSVASVDHATADEPQILELFALAGV
jgi:hypothetical protein